MSQPRTVTRVALGELRFLASRMIQIATKSQIAIMMSWKMQTPPKSPAAAAPLSSVGVESWASKLVTVKANGSPNRSRFIFFVITKFCGEVSTQLPKFIFLLLSMSRFEQSLERCQAAEKDQVEQPGDDREITDDETGDGKAAALQVRIRIDLRKAEVTTNDRADTEHRAAATKPEEADEPEDQRPNREWLGWGRGNYGRGSDSGNGWCRDGRARGCRGWRGSGYSGHG